MARMVYAAEFATAVAMIARIVFMTAVLVFATAALSLACAGSTCEVLFSELAV